MNIERVSVDLVITKRTTLIKKVLNNLRLCISYFCLLCITLIFSFQLSATDKKQDIIIVSDDMPASTVDLETESLYYIQDQIQGELIFSEVTASHRRAWRILTARPNVCIYNKVKNVQRERLAIFTKYPLVIFPPNRLIIFDSPNLSYNVSLTKLVKEQNLKIGVLDGRSYGKSLDEEIAELQSYLVILPGYLSAKRLRHMLVQGKLDAIIEYAAIFLGDPDLGIPNERVSFHQLDTATEFIPGYIACSKSEIGAYVVNLFDEALHKGKSIKKLIEMNKKEFPLTEHEAIEQTFNKLHSNE
jgi:uncharacterized protein (TIGR02285 family)